MKKVIIIEHEPLSVRLRKIFCIDELIAKGVDVEYWDLSQLITPNINIPFLVEASYIKRINSIEKLEQQLSKERIDNCVFVAEIFISVKNRKIISLLKKFNCNCIKIDLYANTAIEGFKGQSLLHRIKDPKGFLFSIINKFYTLFFAKNIYNMILTSSSIVRRDFAINHPDYDNFTFKEVSPLLKDRYIVFVDVFYPNHPDNDYSLEFRSIESVKYYKLMSSFFDYVEAKYSLPVIISAHPKAIYNGTEFGNRTILSGNTPNLVKFSELIITHESTSLSYISLANKPFVFVYPNSYIQHDTDKYIKAIASVCQKEAYNLDKCKWDDIEFSKMNEQVRLNYIYKYLTSKDCEGVENAHTIYNSLQKL